MANGRDAGRIEAAGRPQIRALTGLRFLAALHVFAFHMTQSDSSRVPGFVRDIAACGYVAVSFFFVLSGFILTYVHTHRGGLDLRPRDFYVARFARI